MKKIISLILVSFIIFGVSFDNLKAEEKKFVVTAYYSPLPNQENYMRGDFEKEKILQGNGTHGASGKKVFSGMFAAPKNYDFGTKISLEGLGVGVVEDRGQAIVEKGERGYEYDRLDIWMGYGDEGLKRALNWGKRTINGKVLSSDKQVTFNNKLLPAPDSAIFGLKNQKEKTIFDINIGKNSNIQDIKKIQIFFKENLLYSGKIDGIYNSEIIKIIYDFQISEKIVSSKNDSGAGYWGEVTRKKFEEKFKLIKVLNKKIEEESYKNISEDIFGVLDNKKETIEKVENIFKEIGFYKGNVTGDLKNLSKIIYDFQISEKIISSKSDPGAGFYGPKTRDTLKNKYLSYKNNKKIEEEKILELTKIYEEFDTEAKKEAKLKIDNLPNLKKGDVSQSVRELQIVMNYLGYLKEKPTAIYGEKTLESVKSFQKEYSLDENNGVFGLKTKEKLKEKYINIYKNNKILEKGLKAEDIDLVYTLYKNKKDKLL